jgi:hypothetical protein
MRQFYFQLGQLEPKAQALRLAKLKLLRSGTALQHPQFWAAFVMNGDGLSPMVRVFSWSSLLAPAAAVLLVAGALVARRIKPARGVDRPLGTRGGPPARGRPSGEAA